MKSEFSEAKMLVELIRSSLKKDPNSKPFIMSYDGQVACNPDESKFNIEVIAPGSPIIVLIHADELSDFMKESKTDEELAQKIMDIANKRLNLK